MSGGVFAVARNIFEHDCFEDEPFTEREAWLWIIREAAWKPRKVRIGKSVIALDRGQCAFSIRFMAERWKWSKSRVARFLDRLKNETMIGTGADQTITVITVCNYDDYQRVSLPDETPSGTDDGTSVGQQRDKQEIITNTITENIPLRGPAASTGKTIEAEVFAFGKTVLGKSSGGIIVNLRKACEYDDEQALDLLRQSAEKHDPMAWINAAIKSVKGRPYRGAVNVETNDGPSIESRDDREWRKREAEIYRGVDCAPLTAEERAYALANGLS